MHVEHIQEPSFALGFAMPAALQSNSTASAFAAPGRGASQMAHFSVVLASLAHMQVEHVHEPSGLGVGFAMPAAAQLKLLLAEDVVGALLVKELGPAPGDERALRSYGGSVACGSALALSFANCEISRRVAVIVSVNVGSSRTLFASTIAFASFGVVATAGLFCCTTGFAAAAAGGALSLGAGANDNLGAGGGAIGSGASSLSTETWLRSDEGRAGANFLKRS